MSEAAKKINMSQEMIEFEFLNLDPSMLIPETREHHQLEFTFNGQRYKFIHGKKYRAPRAVMDHLNGVGYPVYSQGRDAEGQPEVKHTGWENRFRCIETR